MVAWKKRNLLDQQYSEFTQHIVGLTVRDTTCQLAQLKFGTQYMLATLVHLPNVEDAVLRQWKLQLGKGTHFSNFFFLALPVPNYFLTLPVTF